MEYMEKVSVALKAVDAARLELLRLVTAEPDYGLQKSLEWLISVPLFPWVFLGHCLFFAVLVRSDFSKSGRFSNHVLYNVFTTCVGALGGVTVLNLFFARHPLWMAQNGHLLMVFVAVYIVFYTPFDIGFLLLHNSVGQLVLRLVEEVAILRSCFFGIHLATSTFGDQFGTAIVCAIIASVGGYLLLQLQRTVVSRGSQGSRFYSDLSRPSWMIRQPFYAALVYLLLHNLERLFLALQSIEHVAAYIPTEAVLPELKLREDEIRMIVLLLGVSHCVVTSLISHVNPFGLIELILGTLLNVRQRSATEKPREPKTKEKERLVPVPKEKPNGKERLVAKEKQTSKEKPSGKDKPNGKPIAKDTLKAPAERVTARRGKAGQRL